MEQLSEDEFWEKVKNCSLEGEEYEQYLYSYDYLEVPTGHDNEYNGNTYHDNCFIYSFEGNKYD